VYTIDLATLLQLLREFRRSGLLRTEISSGLPRLKKPCFVIVELQRGEMIACHVKDSRGQTLLTGQDAIRAVSAAGKLNWVFDAMPEQALSGGQPNRNSLSGPLGQMPPLPPNRSQTSPTLPVPRWPADFTQRSLVPHRLIEMGPMDMNGWPRRHRQVYVLIDGIRNAEKIAAMLSLPALFVEEVLREIQSIGAIVLREL
jgi:hypothetical protein